MAKKRMRRVKILIIIGAAVAALLLLRAKLRPYVVSLAEMEGKRLGSAAINDGVVAVFAEEKLTYGDVVDIAYAADGRVVSLHADAKRLNALRLAVGDAVSETLEKAPPTSVRVSLGSLLGELFAGRGFAITVKLDSISTVDVDFSSEFASAGINQTLHRITMTVEVRFTILAATYRVETLSTCSFNLAETVIVGDVPENYTGFDF
ncbi:MAG: sporulation protein YunB [Clostridia bacterium]|nr:sporulation protein YunB [Clostridia bacterium]